MKRIASFIVNKQAIILFVITVLSFLFAFFLRKIVINSDLSSYLPKTDPAVKLLDYIGEKYRGNSLAIVIIKSDDVFKLETIKAIDYLTRQFRQIDGVTYVTSLTNILDIKKTEEGLEIGKLIDEDNIPNQEVLYKIKEYALRKEIYRNKLISEDSKTTLIICRIDGDKSKVAKTIERVTKNADLQNIKTYFAGLPFQLNAVNDMIIKDIKILLPFVALVILLILYLSFGSLLHVVLPLISVGLSALWTIGLMALLKIPLTIITNIIPAILMAVGSAYAIHIICKFMEEKDENVQIRAKNSLSKVIIPVFLAALTTIIGFTSFIFGSYLIMIQQFGVFTSLGIIFAFLLSITIIPIILGNSKNLKLNQRQNLNFLNRIMEHTGYWILRHKDIVWIVGAVIGIGFLFGTSLIKTKVDFLDYFKEKSSIRITEKIMEESFGGSVPIQILIKGDLQDPEVLLAMKDFHNFLDTLKGVYHPQSIIDLIEEMNDAMGEGKKIPDTKEKINNLYFLLEGEETIEQLINDDKTEGIIQAMTAGAYNEESELIIKKIRDYIKSKNNGLYNFEFTGSAVVYQHLNQSLLKSQLISLIIAIVAIFICLLFLTHSLSASLLGLVPIFFGLSILFGTMGFLKIPLDVATVLLGSICVGIGIDYSIHFLNRYSYERKQNNPEKALLTSIKYTGSAIVVNVFTVMLGFLVLIFSNLVPVIRFGILLGITMLSTGLGATVLLPAVILKTKENKTRRTK
ncbi:MAG: MMPL family transporter [candidate division WOR-3 bacterium]